MVILKFDLGLVYLNDINAMIKKKNVVMPDCLDIPQEASWCAITLMKLLWAHICSSAVKVLKFTLVRTHS